MHSISTSAFLGSVLTATQLLEGLCEKCFSYSAFISYNTVSSHASRPARPVVQDTWRWTYRKIGHVGEEDGGLDDLVDGGAGLREDGLDVLDAEGSLLGDGAVDDGARVVHVDLARAVNGRAGLSGVRLKAV